VALDLAGLAVLLGLAAFLGAWGGAPFYHPDTLIDRALRTMAQSGDPKFFNYPALLLYLDGFIYQAWLKELLPAGTAPLEAYLAAVRAGQAWGRGLFVPGQMVTLAFSLLGVAATYFAALRLLRSRAAALAAGLILCTSLLWATDAHYITVDTPLAGLGMLTVTLTLYFSGTGRAPGWPDGFCQVQRCAGAARARRGHPAGCRAARAVVQAPAGGGFGRAAGVFCHQPLHFAGLAAVL
jgi:hypothetical protein